MIVGFIGLGIMGRPMAGHLLAAGHQVLSARHRTPLPEGLLDAGLEACDCYRDIAQRSEVVITMVSDTPDVEQVLFESDGVAAGLAPGKILIDMSTISASATKGFAERIEELGCDYIDAPVSGGDVGAQSATLSIMAGGRQSAFDRVMPLFECLGKTILRVGEVGAGQACKAANQILVAVTVQAVSEALVFASKAGVDPAKAREALLGGLAGSRILEIHGARMIEHDFAPGFRIELHQKDLKATLDSAQEIGVSLPATALVQQMFNACAAAGLDKNDNSALVTLLENLAQHRLGD